MGAGLDLRLVQSYAWNSVIEHANQDQYYEAFMEAWRLKDSVGSYLPLNDERLWPAFMSGMNSCKHCEVRVAFVLLIPAPHSYGCVYN